MPHEVEWWIDRRVIRVTPTGRLEVAHVAEMDSRVIQLVAAGDPPVHIVMDLETVTHYPPTLETYLPIVRPSPHPEQLGWVVVVEAQDAALRFIMTVLSQLLGVRGRVYSTDTLVEALHFLREQDATLPSLEARTE
ncbi:MAG: hypothetical protein JNM70_04230 [Anaerolineae bacterium]|nr:hypothetical protein [Anaerolineae bacterium]